MARAAAPDAADTIYFGGGTPSLLEPDEIGRIIARLPGGLRCRRRRAKSPSRRIPKASTEARLAGVSRRPASIASVSVSNHFGTTELRRLSRLHTADRARAAVAEARAAGFDNISLDLMMWLPEQRVADGSSRSTRRSRSAPEHLSLYLLEVYPNAPLKDDMARARWSQAPDDDAAAMYLTAMERLEAAGLRAVRDFERRAARPALAAQPEILDRRRMAWLRLRRALDPRRRPLEECRVHRGVHPSVIERGESPAIDHRPLSPEERLGDALFTGLRLTEGVNLDAIRAALRRRRLGALWRRARAVPRGWAAAAGRRRGCG